jgi:hypothetical protein
MRQSPGIEHQSVNDEWSAVQTLRHLVFVHDSWFRRCCLGSTDLFTPIGLGIESLPGREEQGLDPSADPTLDEVLATRDVQAAELERWLDAVTSERLQEPAPIPDNDLWPPYARGRSVRQCLGTVLSEEFEHHQFCVRDLDLIERSVDG